MVVVERFGADAFCNWSLSRSPGQLPDRCPHIFGFKFVDVYGAQPCLVFSVGLPIRLANGLASSMHAT